MDKHKPSFFKDKIYQYILFAVIISYSIFNFPILYDFFINALSLAFPFYIALVIAFLFNIPMSKIESFLCNKLNYKFIHKHKRAMSITITLIILLSIIGIFSSFIIPRIGESISLIINNMPSYLTRFTNFVNKTATNFNLKYSISYDEINNFFNNINLYKFLVNLLNLTSSGSSNISIVISSVSGTVVNVISAIFMAIYLLANKETHIVQFRKLIIYLLKPDRSIKFFEFFEEANHYFNGFVTGQMLEATIFMTIIYTAMRILSMPFAEIIAIAAFFFSFIPMFGGFLTLTIGIVLVSAASPEKILLFIIVFVLLQQFEGNVVYPRIMGRSVGISGLFVLLGITIFGRLFNFVGILIAVPLTALIYALMSRIINIHLYRHHIEVLDGEINEIDDEGKTKKRLY